MINEGTFLQASEVYTVLAKNWKKHSLHQSYVAVISSVHIWPCGKHTGQGTTRPALGAVNFTYVFAGNAITLSVSLLTCKSGMKPPISTGFSQR